MKQKFSLFQCLLSFGMILISLTMVIPLLNILAISLSDSSVSTTMNGLEIIPKEFTLVNYQLILENPNIMPALKNSIFITLVGTLINVSLTCMAAYALTKKDLVGRQYIMVFLVIMMLFDPGLIPEYLTIQQLNLMGSQWSVILVTAVNVYYLIILMRYFEAVPAELYEAAKLDGAGHFRILWQIAVPLTKTGIAVITMFYGVLRWNEYFKSGLYISSPEKTPLPVILREFLVLNDTSKLLGVANTFDYEVVSRLDINALKYAAIVVSIIPILLIYPFVLKFYAKDVMSGGVKE
ncbi:MAG: carbohydrate ABC transporter permease [Eubacteriales bacterium]